MKEKGLYRNTVGARKESVQKPLPIRSQNKNKNETHKAQMQVLGVGWGRGSLQCSILKPESRSSCSRCFSIFFRVSVPGSGNGTLSTGPTHCYCLKKVFTQVHTHTQPLPASEPRLARSILNFSTSCAVFSSVIFPHPD